MNVLGRWLLATMVVGLLAILAASAQVADPSRSEKSATLSRSKQVGISLLLYCSDYDDVLPWPQDSHSCWRAIHPYSKNRDIFKTLNPNGGEFAFNMALGGVSMRDISAPERTIMVHETKAWPDGGRVGTHVDGSARFFTAEMWKERAKTLNLKLKRTAKKPLPKDWLKKEMGDW
ncbi:MAG TPA: hypothetical protein PLH94_11200 [Fimbriimonadaceae bacterium]|nr:hypothetical protein [Fimbriimonadaceae bacterium]